MTDNEQITVLHREMEVRATMLNRLATQNCILYDALDRALKELQAYPVSARSLAAIHARNALSFVLSDTKND